MAGSLPSTLPHLQSSSRKIFPRNSIHSNFIVGGVGGNRCVKCFSSKKKKKQLGFFDQILDYIEGGPKLRKWYGAPDPFSNDGSTSEKDDESTDTAEDEVRDAVLVMDGDSEIGQMVILNLIVKRARVRTLVKDKRAAMESFGTYVEAIAGDVKDSSFLKKTLKGVRAIICPNEGFLSNAESLKGVQHLVLLSQLSVYRGSSGVQAIMNSNAMKLAEQDESVVIATGIPYTIIRTGSLINDRGGKLGFNFKEGCAAEGSLSKEDAAFICMEALDTVPQKGLIFEKALRDVYKTNYDAMQMLQARVVQTAQEKNMKKGSVVNGEEEVSNWKDCFATLMEKAEQQ